jgi:hypothetical protein
MRRPEASIGLKPRVVIIAGLLTVLVLSPSREKHASRSDEISVKSL